METLQNIPAQTAEPLTFDQQIDSPIVGNYLDDQTELLEHNRFRSNQTKLTIVIIALWTIVQGITLVKNFFIYNLLNEPIDYTNSITKRAIPWLTAIVFIFIINYTSRFFIQTGIKLVKLPLIHFVLALIISVFMYILGFYGVSVLGLSTFENSSILKYFMIEIDRLFLIYLLISITTTAHYYFHEIRTKELVLHRMENAYRQSKIISLNNEVNPHMIFNTLNNIYTLINEDFESAKKMIVDFASLLRQNLKTKDRIYTTLSHDRHFLEKYVELQNVNEEKRIILQFDFNSDLKDAVLPKMILQPLIENAIKHTKSNQIWPLIIYVSAQKINQNLHIIVSNQTNELPHTFGDTVKIGLGTENIIKRLRVLYQNNFKFNVQKSLTNYTCNISIPYTS